jgi:hypothetical protein
MELLFFSFFGCLVSLIKAIEYDWSIRVPENTCFDETCYTDIDDYANSPLVECSYL